jgi:hypothetical protein
VCDHYRCGSDALLYQGPPRTAPRWRLSLGGGLRGRDLESSLGGRSEAQVMERDGAEVTIQGMARAL